MRGWIFRAAHNLAINHVSRSRRHESLIKEWLVDRETEHTENAEERLARKEEIESALRRVTERERHCLMLRAEGLSYQEIGGVLEISAKSVGVYLARGLKRFETQNADKD